MSNFCIMRVKKLKTMAAICATLDHHLRTKDTPNAKEENMYYNWYSNCNYAKNEKGELDRSPNCDIEERKKMKDRAVAQYKKELPQKVRKNAVLTLEFMMTISPEVMQREDFNVRKYMNACDHWAQDKFGKQNVYFIAHHLDETTPHTSIMVLPKDEKGKLNAKKYIDGKKMLSEMQDDFAEKVGKQFGLDRGVKWSRSKHQSIQKWYGRLEEAINEQGSVINQIIQDIPKKSPSETDLHYQGVVQGIIAKKLTPYIQSTINHVDAEKRARNLNATLEQKVSSLADERAANKVTALEDELDDVYNERDVLGEEVKRLKNQNETLKQENFDLNIDAELGKYLKKYHVVEANNEINRMLREFEEQEKRKQKQTQREEEGFGLND